MKYIIDTSILIQALTIDKHTSHVKALFRNLSGTDELIVPQFCLLECVNVLWKHVRFQGLNQSDAELLVEDLLDLPLTVQDIADFLKLGIQIGLKYQLAVYDSVYIAMSKRLMIPLITDDHRQSQIAILEGVVLKSITDFK